MNPQATRPADADDFAALKAKARAALTQEFSVRTEDWTQLTGEQGSTLFFQPNSFLKSDGTLATGEVDVSFIELFDKGSMLVTDMPSNGLKDNGDIALLVSGGEHYVDASQNGEALKMHGQFQLTAPTENTGGPDMDMQMFRMDGEADAWVAEDEEADRKNFGIAGDGPDSEYWTLQSQFGWTNIDRWYSDPRPKTTIHGVCQTAGMTTTPQCICHTTGKTPLWLEWMSMMHLLACSASTTDSSPSVLMYTSSS